MLFYTRWGLRTRSVGEHPTAADTVGVRVLGLRYRNVLLAGVLVPGVTLAIPQYRDSQRTLLTQGVCQARAGQWLTPLGPLSSMSDREVPKSCRSRRRDSRSCSITGDRGHGLRRSLR